MDKKERKEIQKLLIEIISSEGMGNISYTLQLLKTNHSKEVSRTTIFNWEKSNSEWSLKFRQAIEIGSERGIKQIKELALMSLIKNLTQGHAIITMFVLKNLDKENFGEGVNDIKVDNRQIIFNNPKVLETVLKTYRLLESKIQVVNNND